MTDTQTKAAVTWKDATSYSRDARGKAEPTAWECRIEGIRVWVGCGHIYYPGQWVMICADLGIDKMHVAKVDEMPLPAVLNKALRLAGKEAAHRAQRFTDMARICEPHHD